MVGGDTIAIDMYFLKVFIVHIVSPYSVSCNSLVGKHTFYQDKLLR